MKKKRRERRREGGKGNRGERKRKRKSGAVSREPAGYGICQMSMTAVATMERTHMKYTPPPPRTPTHA